MSSRNKSVFTKKQLEEMRRNNISYWTAIDRVKKSGMTPDIAVTLKPMHKFNGLERDLEHEIYALYKGEELITDGTIFEIAEETGKKLRTLKQYTYESYKKVTKNNALSMVFLYNELEEDEE